eukprot:jgi/Phyca11/109644/e_gw1.17.629.1
MGGVDVHDQLRLQRYSVQRSITYRKYYKSLFLGLVDLAITNGFIVHRAYCKMKKTKAMTHVQYMCKLHQQLIGLSEDDMYEENTFLPDILVEEEVFPDTEISNHSPKQNDDWRDHSGQRKRVQKNCKVCAMRTEGKRGATTTYFCENCDFVGPIYLCVKPKWLESNKMMSCWDIWHKVYKNGKEIPEAMKTKIRVRAPKPAGSRGKSPAKRRRVGSAESEDSEDSDASEDSK